VCSSDLGRRPSLSRAVRRRGNDGDEWDVDADGMTLRLGEFLTIGDSGIEEARPPAGSSGPAVVREAGLGEGRGAALSLEDRRAEGERVEDARSLFDSRADGVRVGDTLSLAETRAEGDPVADGEHDLASPRPTASQHVHARGALEFVGQ
jgi:hypothetical protein